MPEVVCPTCRKRLHPPDRLAGRRVTCPRCEAVLTVPFDPDSSLEMPTDLPAPETVQEEPPLPVSVRFGIVSLLLGCISILSLCVPFVGYIAFVLSGIGLPVALWGLFRAQTDGHQVILTTTGSGTGIVGNFGKRAVDYPLAGLVACLFALVLALLPLLLS
jgi:hypothetical protein